MLGDEAHVTRGGHEASGHCTTRDRPGKMRSTASTHHELSFLHTVEEDRWYPWLHTSVSDGRRARSLPMYCRHERIAVFPSPTGSFHQCAGREKAVDSPSIIS